LSLLWWRLVQSASRGFDAIEVRRREKAPNLLGRNAKTRWGEPAGRFAWSRLAVAALVEAGGRSRNGADLGTFSDDFLLKTIDIERPLP